MSCNYLSYEQNKNAYLNLRGGFIDRNKKLRDKDITMELELPPLNDIEYDTPILQWQQIVGDTHHFVWTYDIRKSLISQYPCCRNGSYYRCRPLTKAYIVMINDETSKEMERYRHEQKFNTPPGNNIDSYSFAPDINIFGVNVNFTRNIFNDNVHSQLIDPMMLDWMNNFLNKNKKQNKVIVSIPPSTLYTKQIRPKQPALFNRNGSASKSLIKIHVTIKEEYVFWAVEKLISNLDLFLNHDNELLLECFKPMMGFVFYNYLQPYTDEFPSVKYLSPKGTGFPTYQFENETYYREQTFEANIVIYPVMTDNPIKNRGTEILLDRF